MAETRRFGLSFFGGGVDGALSDRDGKFTSRDRQTIDRLLAAYETHRHEGGTRLANPSAPPTLTLQPGAGSLPAGTTFFYRVSYIDQFGLETAASGESSVTTPTSIPPPQAPGVDARPGGTLGPGVHLYAATLTTLDGSETTLSAPTAVNLLGDFGTVRVSFPDGLPLGADQVHIWRQGPLDSFFTRIGSVPVAGFAFFDDDGSVAPDPCACEPDKLPPDINETNATSAIMVSIPAGDVALPTNVRRWRIYRSTASGNYPADSLVAEVTETVQEGGELLISSYVDDGSPIQLGYPLDISQTITPSVELDVSGVGSGAVLMSDSTGQAWQVTAAPDGALLTSQIVTVAEPPRDIYLDDPVGLPWRVTIDTDGGLITSQEPIQAGSRAFNFGEGPRLATSRGDVSFELSIDASGALETFGTEAAWVEVPARTADPAAPVEGGRMYADEEGAPFYRSNDGDVNTVVQGQGVTRLIVSPTQPTNPRPGDVWFQTP